MSERVGEGRRGGGREWEGERQRQRDRDREKERNKEREGLCLASDSNHWAYSTTQHRNSHRSQDESLWDRNCARRRPRSSVPVQKPPLAPRSRHDSEAGLFILQQLGLLRFNEDSESYAPNRLIVVVAVFVGGFVDQRPANFGVKLQSRGEREWGKEGVGEDKYA